MAHEDRTRTSSSTLSPGGSSGGGGRNSRAPLGDTTSGAGSGRSSRSTDLEFGSTSPDGGSSGGEPPSHFRELAAQRFPWLSGELLDVYAKEWAETGSPELALAAVRGSAAYERQFPGIKRDDGTLRMSEQQYLGTLAGFREGLVEFGFNPRDFEGQFPEMIERGVGARELQAAAKQAVQRFTEPGGQRTALTDLYMSEFLASGSAQQALQAVRDSSEYEEVFAANRREDGTLRMSEQDYFAHKRGWQRTLISFGLNPEEFEARGRYEESVRHELSIEELRGRLQAVQDGIQDSIEEVRRWYAENYGLELNSSSILGMSIDPEIQADVLERRISASQIGGEAAVRGFERSVERAERLARAGITQKSARDIYSAAQAHLGALSATTRRFNRGATTLAEFEEARGLGDADAQERLRRALRSEQASFGSRSDVRRERGSLGLSGLEER